MRHVVQNHVDKPSITIKLWLALYYFTAFTARTRQTIRLIYQEMHFVVELRKETFIVVKLSCETGSYFLLTGWAK